MKLFFLTPLVVLIFLTPVVNAQQTKNLGPPDAGRIKQKTQTEKQQEESKIIQKSFSDYIKGDLSQRVEIRNVVKANFTTHLSKKQALADLATFRYLINNAYAARDYWESNGLNFQTEFSRIEKFITASKKPISIFDFYSQLAKTFQQGGRDGHLGMELYGRRTTFIKNFRAYFVDKVICEKVGDEFIAISSNLTVKKGDKLSGCNFFPTLSPEGKKYFLPGKRSFDPILNISASVNGINQTLPVHVCRIQRNMRGKYIFKHSVENGLDIVDSPTFIDSYDSQNDFHMAREMHLLGKKLKDKKTILFDITSNHGGEIRYSQQFLSGLNGYANLEMHSAHLVSPATGYLSEAQEKELKGIRKWLIHKAEKTNCEKGQFEGKLIILTDSNVASSGEGTIGYCQSVRNKLVVGENTAGIVNFGNVHTYLLENSGIKISLSNGIFLGLCREGEGFEPDLWVDAPNVRTEVLKWLSDNKSYFPAID